MKTIQKLYFFKGLSGSGKSTLADEMAMKDANLSIVCKDDIREMLAQSGNKPKEKRVIVERDNQIKIALNNGWSVAVCDTNLNGIHLTRIKEILTEYPECELEIIDLTDVPIETCIERCASRPEGKDFWAKVIHEQADKWLEPPLVVQDTSLPWCVISDHDGTIAHVTDRSPYDGTDSWKDRPNQIVVDYLQFAADVGYPIFIFSGLEDKYRPQREGWLKDHKVKYDYLYMRKTGDHRKDSVIKDELFKEHIEGKYYVYSILDDRPQMLRYWINKGFKERLFSIGNPFKEF